MTAPRIPTVAICACLRNSAAYLGYFRAVFSHQIGDGQEFRLLFSLVEGDSSDDTAAQLQAWAAADERVTVTHRSVEPIANFDDRVRKWADLCNLAVDGLEGQPYDQLLWCDSDLCVPADLVKMLLASGRDVVAPAFFLGGIFYDTWGFRGQDGQRFASTHPIHPSYRPFDIFPVNSGGGVVMFSRAVLDAGVRFRGVYEDGLLVGMCNDARAQGFSVYCDTRVSVIHPTSLWRQGLYALGEVEIDADQAFGTDRAARVREAVTVLLTNPAQPVLMGQPTLDADQVLCRQVADRLQTLFPERDFSVCTRLQSEAPKRFKVCCSVRAVDVAPAAAAASAAAPTVVVDGVFFQLYQTGIARVWRSLLQVWADSDFGRRVVVLDRDHTAPRMAGLRYVDLPRYDYAATDADRALLQTVCDAEQAGVFISSYYTTPTRTPSVFMAYDMIPELLGADTAGIPMWREKHHGIRHARHCIAISHNTARDLRRFFPQIAAPQVSVAHCGLDFKAPPAALVEAFRAEHGITRPYFLLVGARGGYKNTTLFFRAFAALGPLRAGYAIVCTGPDLQLAPDDAAHVGAAQVHLMNLDDAALQAAYAGAAALVYPSLYEGFGMPVTEAMACGCPVITTRAGALAEVAGDAALFIDTDDVAGLARALQDVGAPATRQRLVAAGLRRAAGFSWQTMAAQVRAVLEQAIAAPAEPGRPRDELLATAFDQHQRGELEPAVQLYRQLLRQHPQDFVALHMLGVARYQQGAADEAEQWLRQALAQEGRVAEVHHNLGNVLLAQGRHADASACFQTALALKPDFELSRRQLATLAASQPQGAIA